MVRTKAPALHFDTSNSFTSVAGDAAVHQVIHPASPHRSSAKSNHANFGKGGRHFMHAAAKKALFKKNRGLKRYRPGIKALKEIRHFQKTTDRLIPAAPFARVVREVAQECAGMNGEIRFQTEALLALQESAEAFLVAMFEQASYLAVHGKRVTLMPRDIQLWRRIRDF